MFTKLAVKLLVQGAAIVAVLLAIVFFVCKAAGCIGSHPTVVSESKTFVDISKIREIKKLPLLVCPHGDVVENQHTNKSGKVVARMIYMYNGTGQIVLDLEKVKWDFVSDNSVGKTNLVVRLPPLEIEAAVQHSQQNTTNEYECESRFVGPSYYKEGYWARLERIARTTAQDNLKWYMRQPERKQQAKQQAEMILKKILSPCVDEVRFEWSEDDK